MKLVLLIVVLLSSLYTSGQRLVSEDKSLKKNSDLEKTNQKTIVAKFTKAEVLEGAGSYTFKDAAGQLLHFAFDDYSNQNLPYNFFDNEGNSNPEFIDSTFKIKYSSTWEIRGESEEKLLVNKITRIKLIKKGA